MYVFMKILTLSLPAKLLSMNKFCHHFSRLNMRIGSVTCRQNGPSCRRVRIVALVSTNNPNDGKNLNEKGNKNENPKKFKKTKQFRTKAFETGHPSICCTKRGNPEWEGRISFKPYNQH